MKKRLTCSLFNNYKRFYHHNQKGSILCFVTTIMSFILGFTVGILLPIYVFTNSAVDFGPDSGFFQIIRNHTENPISETLQLVSPINSVINSSSDVRLLSVLIPKEDSAYQKRTYINKFYPNPGAVQDAPGATHHAIAAAEIPRMSPSVGNVNFLPTFFKSLINKTKEKEDSTNYASVSLKVNFKKKIDTVPNSGIFWSNEIERHLPKGFDEQSFNNWRHFVNRSVIVKVEEGCGRMQNRQITFDDGVKACCRYRQNNDQIQGEIFSFYLARLLAIENLPPSSLAIVRGNEWQWDYVRSYIQLAQWSADRPVVLTQFVDKLSASYIPSVFRNASRRLHPSDPDLRDKSVEELVELVQWSDLIVFDYITANLDRVVNNMYNEQWNSEMMKSPAHNLARSDSTGLLVFLDNESGLLHGYRLLDKYEHYHLSLLKSLCIFKHSTFRALETLRNKRNVAYLLKDTFEKVSPHMRDWLPFIPDRYLKILGERIERVYQHMIGCHERYGSGNFQWTAEKV